jgi:Kef-type K+ transport system membrane component KefB
MITLAAVFALLANRFKQPLLLGYVIAGLILGPAVTGIVSEPLVILAFFAEFGLILLLFIIGLELDFTKIKSLGKMSIIIGTAQILLITLIVFGLALLFGLEVIPSLYAGLVVAFSSTLVVVKALAEKKELDTEHGNMILGILIVEDILAVIGLTLLGVLVESGEASHSFPTFLGILAHAGLPLPHAGWFTLVELLINGILFILAAYAIARYLLPKVMNIATDSTELLFCTSLAVALVLGGIGGFFGFSLAIGAFVAGIVLSSSAYRHEIMGKAKPVKDFFLVLFFVALGTLLTFADLGAQLKLVALLLVTAVVMKPIIVFFVRKAFKYDNRISFLISVALAQISEFSLILAMAGVAQGAIPPDFMTGAVIATLISMMLTVYLIKYDEQLYALAKPLLAPIERLFGLRKGEHHHAHQAHKPAIIIFGINNVSAEAIEALAERKGLLVVEQNPKKTIPYRERGIDIICSDAYNIDLYEEHIDFSEVKTVVSVIADTNTNLFILKKMRQHKGVVSIIAASTEDEGRQLYKAGASMALIPNVTGRQLLTELLNGRPHEVHDLGKAYFKELDKHFVYWRE